MIRSNLVTILIILSLGWIVDGYAEAAKPISPTESTGETIQQLLRIVGVDEEIQEELALEPRVPMRKPTMIERSAGDDDARLIIKFTDQTQMRMDSIGKPFSKSNQNIESIAVILEELNLTLEPVFSGPEARITELIRRAEENSGQAQPDLAGIFYLAGDAQDIDGAAMILLHDPRVEWAGYQTNTFKNKTLPERIDDAIDIQMKQNPAMAIAMADGQQDPQQDFDRPNMNLANAAEPTTRFGAMSDDSNSMGISNESSSKRDEIDLEDVPQRATPPACCVNNTDFDPVLLTDLPGQNAIVPLGGGNVWVFNACLPGLNAATCDTVDGVFFPNGSCDDPLDQTFIVCEQAAPQNDPEWSPLGACCSGGAQTFAPRADCEEGFIHDWLTRFDPSSYPSAFEPTGGLLQTSALPNPPTLFGPGSFERIPDMNSQVKIEYLATLYGFENMIVPGGDVLVAQNQYTNALVPIVDNFDILPANEILNSNYSYYTGSNRQLLGGSISNPNSAGGFPGVPGQDAPQGGFWTDEFFITFNVPDAVPIEPIFVQQNATFPYAANTGIVEAMYSFNGPGPDLGALNPPGSRPKGYDPLGLYPGADPTPGAALGPWIILWGMIDIAVNTATGEARPAYLNQVATEDNPNGITGGFTFYSLTEFPTGSGNFVRVYNPNIYLAGPDSTDSDLCQFGVCAIDCWEPERTPPNLGCGPNTHFAGYPYRGEFEPFDDNPALGITRAVRESPIISKRLEVPNTNMGCSQLMYEAYCKDGLLNRSFRTELNASGSLWQDLNQLPLVEPILAGCATINEPYGDTSADEDGWFGGYFQDPGLECIDPDSGDQGYAGYVVPDNAADPLKGSCFYSNMSYPAMFINQYSLFQLQAFGSTDELNNPPPNNGNPFEFFYEPCYGGNNGEQREFCPTYCAVNPAGTDVALPDAVCTAAPICCDNAQCSANPVDPNNPTLTSQELAGWSFICADLANQWKIDPYQTQVNNPTYNTIDPNPPNANTSSVINKGNTARRRNVDFDQMERFAGPFPELNILGLQAPYARNADGSIWDDPNIPGNAPTIIAPSLNCMINYGVQNQCFTTYFSEFQPSLGLAPNSSLPPFLRRQNGGCMDFQCCHTVCSIIFDPSVDDFNYGSCCDPAFGWTEECVDKAIELCYENEGGVRTSRTPNFVPLQFHLSQRTAAGPQPFRLFDQGTRRLTAAPTLPPTVTSAIPGIPTFRPDNWLQSANMVQWVVNGQRNPIGGLPVLPTWAAPSVLGTQSTGGAKYGIQFAVDPNTGDIIPAINTQAGNANSWEEFYYGEPISPPPTFYESQGLSLYGTMDSATWGRGGGYASLTPTTGLYSWADFLLSLQDSNGPAGPTNNGAFGFGVNIAVLDTSAWIQEYTNTQGQLVGAVHEDLGNVFMEGPATGDQFVPMGFENFIFEPQRGTAVLGTIAATQNGFGTDGIALQSNTMFFPVMTAQGSLNREFNAWLSAMTHLKRGDIIVATYPSGGETDNIWIDGEGNDGSIIGLLFGLTAALDITVILPMGDYGIQLPGSAQSELATLPDNVLLVGGSMPSTLPKRAWSSNYMEIDSIGNLPITCAISPITTTGGDCNLTRAAIDTTPDQPNDPSGYISREMKSRSYTNDFGYLFDSSKAAAAQVAGVAACLQGLSMQWYGANQPGSNLARIINNNPRRIGGLLNGPAEPETQYTSAALQGEGWQYGLETPEGGILTQYVGGMIDPARAGVDLVINPEWNVNATGEVLTQAEFIRGYRIDGDYTSLQQPGDANEMVGYSQFTFAFVDYEPEFFVPGSPFNYNASFDFAGEDAGEVTDLFIHGQANNKNLLQEDILAFDVQLTLSPDPEGIPLAATELLIQEFSPYRQGFVYNYETEQWDLMVNTLAFYPLFSFQPPGETDGRSHLGFEGSFDVRFVLTIPTDVFDENAYLNEYVVFYDYVSLRISGPIEPP